MAKGTKVKTQVGKLKYVFIKGDGRNGAMPGEEPRMQFVASLSVPTDGPAHKAFQALVDEEWATYKKANNVKGLPGTNGMKPETKPSDDKTDIDPATEEVRKVETGNTLITFKTNTKWPDGKPQAIKLYGNNGESKTADITEAYARADWFIGEGSTGIIHGTAQGNNIGGSDKVTLYLSAVQLGKLVKGEGEGVDIDEDIESEAIDMGDDYVAPIEESGEQPDL